MYGSETRTLYLFSANGQFWILQRHLTLHDRLFRDRNTPFDTPQWTVQEPEHVVRPSTMDCSETGTPHPTSQNELF